MKAGRARLIAVALFALASPALLRSDAAAPERARLMRVPNGGIQPQVAVDSRGTIHLIYFKGNPEHGDIYYTRSKDWGARFSAPIRVNSQPGSAVALGTIRGAHIAVSGDGRVYVAWNGSSTASPGVRSGRGRRLTVAEGGSPMLLARLTPGETVFETQRNLMRLSYGLDGGGSVAAGPKREVYVAWHGDRKDQQLKEAERRVWVARSLDHGREFAPETAVNRTDTGACGCCGLDIFVDREGAIYVLYRTAKDTVHRDIHLLVSTDRGRTFQGRLVDPWTIGACPLSSVAFAQGPDTVEAAWQTKTQVYYASITPGTLKLSRPIPAPGAGTIRKYPALAVNSTGDTLLVWTDGAGWGEGGSLGWQVFDREGRLEGAAGHAPGVPSWSFGAAFARPDGGFTILY